MHARQAEAGAGALLALVEDHAVLAIFGQILLDQGRVRVLRLERDEPRIEILVTEIDPVGPRVELPLVHFDGRHHGLQHG